MRGVNYVPDCVHRGKEYMFLSCVMGRAYLMDRSGVTNNALMSEVQRLPRLVTRWAIVRQVGSVWSLNRDHLFVTEGQACRDKGPGEIVVPFTLDMSVFEESEE